MIQGRDWVRPDTAQTATCMKLAIESCVLAEMGSPRRCRARAGPTRVRTTPGRTSPSRVGIGRVGAPVVSVRSAPGWAQNSFPARPHQSGRYRVRGPGARAKWYFGNGCVAGPPRRADTARFQGANRGPSCPTIPPVDTIRIEPAQGIRFAPHSMSRPVAGAPGHLLCSRIGLCGARSRIAVRGGRPGAKSAARFKGSNNLRNAGLEGTSVTQGDGVCAEPAQFLTVH